MKECVTLEVEGAKQRKTCEELVDKDVDDLHSKLSDEVDPSKWWVSINRMVATTIVTLMPRADTNCTLLALSHPG